MTRNFTIAKVLLLAVLALGQQLPVYGVEVFTVGAGNESWADLGTTPGGVIAFVDRLDEVEDAAGEHVFVGVADSLRDWIMPLRLNP